VGRRTVRPLGALKLKKANFVLAGALLVLTVGGPFTMPARASVGDLDGPYVDGLARGWVVLAPQPEGPTGFQPVTPGNPAVVLCRYDAGNAEAGQRAEVGAGAIAWLTTCEPSVRVSGRQTRP